MTLFSPEALLSRRGLLRGSGATTLAAAWQPAKPLPVRQGDAPGLVLGPGVHEIAANMILKADVLLMPDARIAVAVGRTLTVLGDFQAPVAPVFIGAGRIDLNRSRVQAVHPEWWGARTDDPSSDCLAALRAAIAAHHSVVLGPADYHLSDTLVIDRAHARIWGSGYRSNGDRQGTRLLVDSGTADVVQVGPARRPATVNDFQQGVDLRWMELTRSRPVAAGAGREAAGLRVRFVLHCRLEGISASEHSVGSDVSGAVRTYFHDCIVFRSIPAIGGTGAFHGFRLDGTLEIGLAGGNASIFLVDCNVSVGGKPSLADPVGLLLEGAFADSFVERFETAGVATGIRVDGRSSALGGRRRSGHANPHLSMPIIDQCSACGIMIADVSDYGMIDIVDPYVAVAPGALAGIRLDHLRGLTTILGGQVIGWVDADAGGNALGLYATNSEGLTVTGLKLLDLRRPIGLDRCSDVAVAAGINNPGHSGSQAALWLRDCQRGRFDLHVKGRNDAFPQGVYLLGACDALRLDVTGVAPAAITGGAVNRVLAGDRALPVPSRTGRISVDGPA